MFVTSATKAALGLVLSATLLSGCTAGAQGDTPDGAQPANAVLRKAPLYVGDPWEKRFRDQFWADQHIHDSWNPCHIGENVPKRLQGSGPECWSRLPARPAR